MNNTTDNIDEETGVLQTFQSRLFWIIFFCLFALISLFALYFYFYHLFQRRQNLLYNNLNNHTLVCLLITDYLVIQTELPITIGFLLKNRVIVETHSFCVFWTYWNFVWSTMSIQFSMLTAINRYLLVFHKAFLMKHKMFCHYLPMVCIWLYLPCLYLYFIVFFPYGNTTFDFSYVWCGGPQFQYISFYGIWDILFNAVIPIVVIILFNLIVITKVVLLKMVPTGRANKWQKNRRMILQLLAICCSQLIGGLPYTVISLGIIYGSPTFAAQSYTQVFTYTFYIPNLCSPLFAIVTLPKEVRDKIALIFECSKKKQSATVGPTTGDQLQPAYMRRSVTTRINNS